MKGKIKFWAKPYVEINMELNFTSHLLFACFTHMFCRVAPSPKYTPDYTVIEEATPIKLMLVLTIHRF